MADTSTRLRELVDQATSEFLLAEARALEADARRAAELHDGSLFALTVVYLAADIDGLYVPPAVASWWPQEGAEGPLWWKRRAPSPGHCGTCGAPEDWADW